MEDLTILIADDHEIYRNGLCDLLRQLPKVGKVLEANSLEEMLNMLNKTNIDIVFLDIEMAPINGIDTLFKIKQKFPAILTVIITIHNYDTYILEAYNNKVDAYLLKNTELLELKICLELITQNINYYTPEIAKKLKQLLSNESSYN